MSHFNVRSVPVTVSLLLLGVATGHAQTLQNDSFDEPSAMVPPGEAGTATAVCTEPRGAVGQSASEHWTLFGNTARTSVNSWLTTAPGGFLSNLLAVGGNEGGIVQVLSKQYSVTSVNRVGAWVYVVQGSAYIQIGNGGSGGGDVGVSTGTGSWEYISACGRRDMMNNEIIVYSTGGPAVFYVDDASIWFDPAC